MITDTGLVTQAIHQAVLARLATLRLAVQRAKRADQAPLTRMRGQAATRAALYNITVLGFQRPPSTPSSTALSKPLTVPCNKGPWRHLAEPG